VSRSKPILLALFTLGLGLVAAELAFRFLGVGGPLELGPNFDREEVHYLQEEPWKDARVWSGGPFYRLAVIGDSFTVGQGVSWMDAYPYRLQGLMNLNAKPPPVALEVFAENGLSTVDELRFLQPALNWGADLIVLGLFLNDSEYRQDPRLKKTRLGMLPRVPEGLVRNLTRSSRVVELLYERLEALRRRNSTDNYGSRIYEPEYQGWKSFDSALGEFARVTQAAGVPLVAVIFPYLAGIENEATYARVGHERFGAALDRHGIVYLDLLDAFAGKSRARMEAFPGVDGHPSEIGHRIAARAIFDFLLEEGLLDESFRPRATRVDRTRSEWLRQLRRYKDTVHYPD